MGLILAGLVNGLLTLAGAALLEKTSAGGEDASGDCIELQVGSLHAADTHIHLENAGPDTARVRFDWVAGLDGPTTSHDVRIAPWVSADFVVRTPALGATIRFVSSVSDLHASAEIRPDPGREPDSRHASRCPAP